MNLDACRYVTDFGIELAAQAFGNYSLVDRKSLIGCKKILKYMHQSVSPDLVSEDLFLAPSFNKLQNLNSDEIEANAVELNVCKIVILNHGDVNMIKFIQNKLVITANKPIIGYGNVRIPVVDKNGSNVDYKFNIVEINSVSSLLRFTQWLNLREN